jgi:uncharacterized ion transporter superfamily protein YfcC
VTIRLPHPLVLLSGCVVLAAVLTWLVPAGQFDRRSDERTGRTVVVPGTYVRVEPSPITPFQAVVSIPRGFIEAAEVIAAVLFVGAAWVVVDRTGTLDRIVTVFVHLFRRRHAWAIPTVSLFFAVMGGLENMQEEIIPLVPVLLLLGRRLGIDAVTVVAMSAGAAMVGSAFGPTNPFQAGIARTLAELPPLSRGGLRFALFAAAFTVWLGWTMRHARRQRPPADAAGPPATSALSPPDDEPPAATPRDAVTLVLMLAPMAFYVYGAMAWGWGFNELSAGFLAGGIAAGLIAGLGVIRTIETYLAGMQVLLPAAVMVGVARSISVVLADGRVIDTILYNLSEPLGTTPAAVAGLLMIPFHAAVHVVISSVSGHAVLTMPLLVPLSDLLGISREVTVLAYQTGAGLTELLTPTNGSLMAILLAAGVSYGEWIRFALIGVLLTALIGMTGMFALGA